MAFWDKYLNLRTTASGRRPPSAVEIAPEGVLAGAHPAARIASGSAPVVAFAALPAGAVVPGIAEPNLRQPEAVAEAVKSALDQVSPRSRSVSVVVPDISARVFVLDFDSLPAKTADALPVLRFRLRKVLPFDVEQATVSYQVLSEEKHAVRVLTIVMPSAILAEYEGAVRTAGYEPGAVLPAGLAALASLHAAEPALVATLSAGSLSTAITRGNDLLLYRAVELPVEPDAALDEVRRGAAVAAAYFEDHVGAPPERLYVSGSWTGTAEANVFAEAIAETGLTVEEIAPAPTTGAMTAMGPMAFAGVFGALEGAA